MAVAYKQFDAYFCSTAEPYENIAAVGRITVTIVSATGYVYSSTKTDEAARESLAAIIPELSQVTGKAFISNSYLSYLERLQTFFPTVTRFGVKNETGRAVKLKLVAPNESYAISLYNIANGADTFGSSSQAVSYIIYTKEGAVRGNLSLTASGAANFSFFYAKSWDGGDLEPTNANFGYYCVGWAGGGTTHIEWRNETLSQNAADWLNGVTEFPPEDTDPYSGLDGTGGLPSGVVPTPGLPGLTATSTGIIGLFAPNPSQMQALASYMWTDFGGQGTDVVSVLKELVEAFKRAIANPLDYVIGLNIIPSQGLSIGADKVIRFGFTSTGVSMPVLTHQYFTVDCGELSFDEVCGGTFLDYAPYSKFSIYLPYIGVKDVDANDFVGHTIGVIYHGDTVTGGITAYILKDGSVMYQYSGCCALNIPLSSDNWGNTISGAVQIATALAAGAASGGAAGVAKAAALGASSVAANPSLLSPQVAHSGAVSGAAGCMGVQYPFVIREAVSFHSTDFFNTVTGYPSYYYRQLSDVTGYTKVLDVHLHGIPATQDELAEIENILKEGAIF